uniref:Sec20 C-terminal domain-containing protein n=1 Tax=Palpitomonas bilix TaxID=652834 RepID=A0A7S3D4E1_9EUKA|mmetsp:Transcript_2162/g.4457  ORF Transcript_2162/g.4457 Transcript_2162/m.4457 type:complete len:154 (+) Transcript_2162:142-603(+)
MIKQNGAKVVKMKGLLHNIQRRMRDEDRRNLFSYQEGLKDRRRLKEDRDIDADKLETAASITDKLRKTRQLMAQEVEKTSTLYESLLSQTNRIDNTVEVHGLVGASLDSGRRLLHTLQWRESTDKVLMTISLIVFVLVVAYILSQRLIYLWPF